MDKKSQILTVFFALLIMISTVATYYRYIVLEDKSYETGIKAFQKKGLGIHILCGHGRAYRG